MRLILTIHALTVLAEREIPPEWMERTLNQPELQLPDPDDRDLWRYYRRIPEFGGRVLRVVATSTMQDPVRVVSVFFDRNMKGVL